MRIVYESYSEPDALFVKSLLDQEGIESWLYDPNKSETFPGLILNEEFCLTVEDEWAVKAEEVVTGWKNSST